MKVGNGVVQKVAKVCILIGSAGALHTETGGLHHHIAKYHFGVLHKVTVHLNAVLIGIKMHPIGFNVDNAVTLLQEDNIACDLGAGVLLKGGVRQADSANQIGSLRKVFTHGGAFLIHRTLTRNKGDNTARSHFIQGLTKEIVVYEPMVLVVLTVGKAKISERHVADCYVKEAVGHFHFFKAVHGNIAVLIQLLCNSARDTIKFHTVGFAARHSFGEHTDKVADTAGRLQEVAVFEPHLSECLIHCLHNNGRGIKGGQTARSCCGIFIGF